MNIYNSKQCTIVVFLLSFALVPLVIADLRVGFYDSTCPQAESTVQKVVANYFSTNDSTIAGGLLRMHFHDCFVKGCDASILIDPSSTPTNTSEKDAGANGTVRGFDLIDKIKEALEAVCPRSVSCADIITLAGRDAIALSGGPNFAVPTGRRDGLTSDPNNVNLPGPGISVSNAQSIFAGKNITLNEMVTLLGAHTIGLAHCNFFSDRLSSFQGTNKPDQTMNTTLVKKLNALCSSTTSNQTTVLDQGSGSSFKFDSSFYNQILLKNGVLQIDQELADDSSTNGFVRDFASSGTKFTDSFVKAWLKLSNTEVLLGNSGQIRTNCRAFNSKSTPAPATPTTTPSTPTTTPSTPAPAPVPVPAPVTPTQTPATPETPSDDSTPFLPIIGRRGKSRKSRNQRRGRHGHGRH